MGTWGTTAFEDDTAMEFYDNFCCSSQSINILINCIQKVLDTSYVYSDPELSGFVQPVRALVSIEIIAAAYGKVVETFPDEEYHLEDEENPLPIINLENIRDGVASGFILECIKCVSKIKDTPEIHLNQLWKESGNQDEWFLYLINLMDRLKSI